jgi:hypothetical protein
VGKFAKGTKPVAQRADVVARCNNQATDPRTGGAWPAGQQCLNYVKANGQVSPDSGRTDSTVSATTLNTAQIDNLRQQARNAGTYFPASGPCPTTAAQLSSPTTGPWAGAPVVVDGHCDLSLGSTSTVNSPTNPGILVVVNGTLTLGGSSVVYGLLYMANTPASTVPGGPGTNTVIWLTGNSTIQGLVDIDGQGGMVAGSSKTNVIYDPRALGLLRQLNGAAIAKNTWRVLPANQ